MSIAGLRKLPAAEKLKIIEALWSDLAADDEAFVSPASHEKALRATEADFAAGRVEVLDWEEAKKELPRRAECPHPVRVLDCRRNPEWIRKQLATQD